VEKAKKNGFLIPPAQDWGLYKRTTPPQVAGLTDKEATKDVTVFT